MPIDETDPKPSDAGFDLDGNEIDAATMEKLKALGIEYLSDGHFYEGKNMMKKADGTPMNLLDVKEEMNRRKEGTFPKDPDAKTDEEDEDGEEPEPFDNSTPEPENYASISDAYYKALGGE